LVEFGNIVLGLGVNLVLELGGVGFNFLFESGLLLNLSVAEVSGHVVKDALDVVGRFFDLTHSQVVILLVLIS